MAITSPLPSTWRLPFFYLSFGAAGQPGTQNQQTLLTGPTVNAQSYAPVYVPSVPVAVSLFGAGSALAQMVQKYLAADPVATIYCLPVADAGSSTKSAGSIAFTGTTTAAGTLSIYVGGRLVSVAIASGQTAVQVAATVVAALNAYLDGDGIILPAVATVDGTHSYQVDLTANNAGTQGNSIDIRLNYQGAPNEAVPAGLTVAVTAMTGGATDPALANLDSLLAGVNYDFICSAWSNATILDVLKTLTNDSTGRWSYLEQIYGHVWAARRDADATGAGMITFGAARNDQHCTVFGYEPSPSTNWEVAAAAMATSAASLRIDPARPLQTLAVPNILPPLAGQRYTMGTRNTLLNNGIALFDYQPDGTVTISRAVTTYQKNAFGTPDISYLNTERLYTFMTFVRRIKNRVITTFPRAKLLANGTSFGAGTSFTNGQPDQPVATPNDIRNVIVAEYKAMEDEGLVQDTATFAKALIVQINPDDPTRVDASLNPTLASQLNVFAALVQPTQFAA